MTSRLRLPEDPIIEVVQTRYPDGTLHARVHTRGSGGRRGLYEGPSASREMRRLFQHARSQGVPIDTPIRAVVVGRPAGAPAAVSGPRSPVPSPRARPPAAMRRRDPTKPKFKVGDRVRVDRAGALLGRVGTVQYVRRDGHAFVHFDGDPATAAYLVMEQDLGRADARHDPRRRARPNRRRR